MFIKRIILVQFLFCFTIFSQNHTSKNANELKMLEVYSHIDKSYVDTVNLSQIADAAIVAMLEKLDPHSTYIPKDDVDDANEKINGSFVGVGIRFQILKDTIVVVQTIAGGPSEKIGILAGDKLINIEDEKVAGIGIKNKQVRDKLLGEIGTKVKVEIMRKGEKKLLDFIISRDKIPVYSVDTYYMLSQKTGYIKLSSFSKTSTEEIQKGITFLKSKGMKNLILDLQDNGGGLLYTSKSVADEFLSENKLIVYSEGKSQPRSDLVAGTKGMFEDGKLAVLINENSASASEIVSGALQDWDRALIVGRRSFGKGLVQRPINLNDGSQIRLTIARYYTPSGRFIQKPYDDKDSYKNDYFERYIKGELSNQDSIKFVDSLKHHTKLNNRIVYGGGGIMPDVFVPLDTNKYSEFYKKLIRGSYFNSFSLTYVQKNRNTLKKTYPEFESYKEKFIINEEIINEFISFVQKEDKDFTINKEEYNLNKKLIDLRLKAMIAQDLWGISEFYQLYNQDNDILLKALSTIESDDYSKYNLKN